MLVLELLGYPPPLIEIFVISGVAIFFVLLNLSPSTLLSALFALFTSCLILSTYTVLNSEYGFDTAGFLVLLLGYQFGKLILLYVFSFIIIFVFRSLLAQQTKRRIFSRK